MTIKIFCDIADLSLIKKFTKKKIVKGFTTNPSLMRKAVAKNYQLYSKEILKICRNKPISFEVFADDYNNILKQALKINKSIIVCGVTILTSLDNKSLREIGYKDSVEKLVLKQAALIKKAGLKGIVASGSEAKIIRKKYKNLFILTPGIRLPGDKNNDQSRILTPKAALQAGASAIVLGRSIHSGKIKQNIKRLIDHLN